MPSSSLSLDSHTAAITNTGPTLTHELPGGGLEVVHPSEFVPGTNNHIIYGPKNATGDRSVITSYLQPQNTTPTSTAPLYGGTDAPAKTMTLDTEKGTGATTPLVPSTGNTMSGVNPSRTMTVPGGTPGSDVVNPSHNAIKGALLQDINRDAAPGVKPGEASRTDIRKNLLEEQVKTEPATGRTLSTPSASRTLEKQELLDKTNSGTTSSKTFSQPSTATEKSPAKLSNVDRGTKKTFTTPTTTRNRNSFTTPSAATGAPTGFQSLGPSPGGYAATNGHPGFMPGGTTTTQPARRELSGKPGKF
jgi:hypothetical protein